MVRQRVIKMWKGEPVSASRRRASSRRRSRWGWWLIGAVILIAGGVYVSGWFLTGERVPEGTSVAGIDIGGKDADAAQTALRRQFAEQAATPVTLTHDGQTYTLDPAESGLGVDVEATVSNAGGGRSWNPVRMTTLLLGDHPDVEPVVTVDEDELRAAVDQISEQVETSPREPTVQFTADGEPRLRPPVEGVDVDEDATVQMARDAYLATDPSVELPVSDAQPNVTKSDFSQARRDLIGPAVSGPITLQLPGREVDLPVRTYAPALAMEFNDDKELSASVDADLLEERLTGLGRRVGTSPENATVRLSGTEPIVVPAQPGAALDADALAKDIVPVLSETGRERSVRVKTTTVAADVTTAEAKKLRIKRKVSDFVTYYPHARYRNINQGRAAELINGTVLAPGETFSFNDTVGERTRANGFVKGFVISGGTYAEDLGGGVSQVVTTTYNAAFFAGMEDVEHTPHSFYIDRYPLGREATVAWPTVDLKFRNTTPHGVLIRAFVVESTPSSDGEMHVEMYSKKYWDITAGVSDRYNFTSPKTRYDPSPTCVANSGYGGFDVDVYRYFRRAGSDELVDREKDHVTYTPSDSVICEPKPKQRDRDRDRDRDRGR